MKNLIGLPPLPTLTSSSTDKGHATKVSFELTEQVKLVMEDRYKGVRLTKRAAVEVALSEWLEAAAEKPRG